MPADPAPTRLRPPPRDPTDCLDDAPRWTDLYAAARAAIAEMRQVADEDTLSRKSKARLARAIEELEVACDEYDGTFRGRQLLPGMLGGVRGWRPRRYVNGPAQGHCRTP
jgi:hypothetical protein